MKLIIAGSREFHPKHWMIDDAVRKWAKLSLFPAGPVNEIVSGRAPGVDTAGEVWARNHNIPVKPFPADWKKHGQNAGKIRNREMGDYADALLAFWDTVSPGTAHMVSYMTFLGKPVHVVDWRPLKGLY